jgi:hypothetical protein
VCSRLHCVNIISSLHKDVTVYLKAFVRVLADANGMVGGAYFNDSKRALKSLFILSPWPDVDMTSQ